MNTLRQCRFYAQPGTGRTVVAYLGNVVGSIERTAAGRWIAHTRDGIGSMGTFATRQQAGDALTRVK